MNRNLGFRGWFYFRMGWSTYFVFLLAAINTLTVTYFLAIDNYPFLKDIFPSFEQYVVIIQRHLTQKTCNVPSFRILDWRLVGIVEMACNTIYYLARARNTLLVKCCRPCCSTGRKCHAQLFRKVIISV